MYGNEVGRPVKNVLGSAAADAGFTLTVVTPTERDAGADASPRAPSRTRVAFVCPFDLRRLSGTPVRARTTASVLRDICDPVVIATGGVLPEHKIVGVWSHSNRFRSLTYAVKVLRKLRKVRPQVVHAVTTGAVLPAAVYKITHPKVRLVFESHGLMKYEMVVARPAARWMFSTLDRLGVLVADRVIVMSHTQKQNMSRLHMRMDDKAEVIWGPVDVDANLVFPWPTDERLVVGYLGNDSFWQGVRTLLSAADLCRDRDDIRFLVAGPVAAPTESNVIGNVSFRGAVPTERVAQTLAECHVLVSPRVGGAVSSSQYPHKLSHYLAAGRPVIVSDVGDQPLIVQQAQCGRVFDPENADALRDAITAMAAMPRSELTDLGDRARMFAERELGLDVLRTRLRDIYACGVSPCEQDSSD